MKKVYLFLILIIFIFLPHSNVFAKPSFEVYQSGDNPYPTVLPTTSLNNKYFKFVGNDLVIMAEIRDVSGVSSAVAMILDSYGNEVTTVSMLNDGNLPDNSSLDNIYSVQISNVKSYAPGSYQVEILAIDNLNNSPAQPLITDSFSIEQVLVETCSEVNASKICVLISTLSNSDQINIPTVSPTTIMAGNNVSVSANFKTQTSGKKINFKDSTDNVTMGSALTNSSGLATLNSYMVPVLATLGSHTIIAEYLGGPQDQPANKATVLMVTSPGDCKTTNGITICIEALTSLTQP